MSGRPGRIRTGQAGPGRYFRLSVSMVKNPEPLLETEIVPVSSVRAWNVLVLAKVATYEASVSENFFPPATQLKGLDPGSLIAWLRTPRSWESTGVAMESFTLGVVVPTMTMA